MDERKRDVGGVAVAVRVNNGKGSSVENGRIRAVQENNDVGESDTTALREKQTMSMHGG